MENEALFPNTSGSNGLNERAEVIGERVAHRLAGISDRVREGSDSIANRLDDAAGYLRGRGARDFAQDLYSLVRTHPWQALGAVGIAYIAIKLIRR